MFSNHINNIISKIDYNVLKTYDHWFELHQLAINTELRFSPPPLQIVSQLLDAKSAQKIKAKLQKMLQDNFSQEIFKVFESRNSPGFYRIVFDKATLDNVILLSAINDLDEEIIKCMLQQQYIDLYFKDKKGYAALHFAARNNCDDVTKLLINHLHGPIQLSLLSEPDKDGNTPLHLALSGIKHSIFSNLFLQKKSVNKQNQFNTIKVLLDAGSNAWAANRLGLYPISLALGQSQNELSLALKNSESIHPDDLLICDLLLTSMQKTKKPKQEDEFKKISADYQALKDKILIRPSPTNYFNFFIQSKNKQATPQEEYELSDLNCSQNM